MPQTHHHMLETTMMSNISIQQIKKLIIKLQWTSMHLRSQRHETFALIDVFSKDKPSQTNMQSVTAPTVTAPKLVQNKVAGCYMPVVKQHIFIFADWKSADSKSALTWLSKMKVTVAFDILWVRGGISSENIALVVEHESVSCLCLHNLQLKLSIVSTVRSKSERITSSTPRIPLEAPWLPWKVSERKSGRSCQTCPHLEASTCQSG